MNQSNTRELAHCVMMNRWRHAVYLPGALDRIVADVEQRRAGMDRRWTKEEYLDVVSTAIEAQEKYPERDHEVFAAMALPGWIEWAQHAGEMR